MNNNEFRSIQIKPLEYQSTLAKQLFSHIENLPWAMLLRSASESHVDSRYDILVAQPIATFETIGAKTTVNVNETCEVSDSDPFELLDQYQQQLLPVTKDHAELPFVGGALGYFSYDLGRRVETLPSRAKRDIEAPDMAVGLYEWAVVVDHQLKTACIVGNNIEQHHDWLMQQLVQSKSTHAAFGLTTPWQSNMSEESYATKFDSVQEYLLSGDCYQINLAQRFNAQYQGSEWLAYDKLEQYNSAPFSGFIRLANCAIISVSPERFLELKDNVIETKPIKGTRPRSDDHVIDDANAQDLASSDKDQAENLMIVDLLRNDIGRVAKPGTVHVPKLFDIESFPAVHHLVSTIRADLDDQYSATDLLRACFPGGSITGAPKVRAMQIIEELEPHRRSAYCGSIGYISRNGRMDTSITIRTLVAENNTLYAWAGGGVVFDSDCASEYQETLDKLSRILPVLEDC
ncbi:aminodeoxychorismate synthase component I [Vibrio crassostreae]|uniref:aminodeoxychorismate synthase component I n=1 Tax=Vibrio crassostreae TaxID=246167 RepID=UPI00148B8FCA|nr:aminodeoxychorismate synthase component I [Vibrio crassostreae]NOH74792.1 aminodeoxychorismate synthase component I [Vibrio crassostreae]NOI54393.1 aminodeoxychorismate synthase component I [Vibrio crassostreae]CAK2512118.1 aminodeoxychorismate synthase subunit 1 [Vibrio crassostreae]CAK2655574.1 aminodeoxychorismate synthase subunit 1 [Vibrio crassostreae]CAK3266413.1 aminodeoxychorismate synthase subunit 1 [Vibrio crassostreae]